ncbi:hypothetical protein [Ruegeria lacuscaerulensis]|uniref:hypothetical protein n=1 Tax=Ruegeria lacuscaerulensis TaxID=55218 RepID=UPI00147DDBE4|nr:hypothetical protein [Ruegeria lacuscaerulensis]
MQKEMSSLAILVHPGRCGSTVLGGLIGQHSRIAWQGEVFTGKGLIKQLGSNGDLHWRDFLSDRREHVFRPILGVEIKTRQLHVKGIFGSGVADSIQNLADVSNWPLMFLHRKNHIERLVSAMEARRRSRHNYRVEDEPEPVSIRVPYLVYDTAYGIKYRSVSDWLSEVEIIEQQISEEISSRGGLVLSYEEHIAQHPFEGAEAIIGHLQEQPEEAEITYRRINPKNLSERIENFSQLEQWLTPQQFARYCA